MLDLVNRTKRSRTVDLNRFALMKFGTVNILEMWGVMEIM